MASKNKITPNNIHGWLAALGYIFPSTEGELMRFERLHAGTQIPEGELIDPEVVLGRKPKAPTATVKKMDAPITLPFKMAARNGTEKIPQRILDKIKRNQQKPPNDDRGSSQEETE